MNPTARASAGFGGKALEERLVVGAGWIVTTPDWIPYFTGVGSAHGTDAEHEFLDLRGSVLIDELVDFGGL